jgi:hypothetical protein
MKSKLGLQEIHKSKSIIKFYISQSLKLRNDADFTAGVTCVVECCGAMLMSDQQT